MVKKGNRFPCNPFLQNFNYLELKCDLIFHQLHPINMYLHRRKHIFVEQKDRNQLHDLIHSLLLLFLKSASWTLNIISLKYSK